MLNQWGLIVARECATANIADNTLQWLIRQFEERMMVLSDTTSHAAEGDPTNLKLCQHGEWQDRILIAAENAGPPGHRMEGGVSTVEMATPLDLISKVVFSSWLHDLWTTFGRLMRSQITSTISTVWNFTTRSGESARCTTTHCAGSTSLVLLYIWLHANYSCLTAVQLSDVEEV